MRLEDPQLVELLAQRYVLGVQRGMARRRFASLIRARPEVRRRVNYWERRLTPLAWSLPPIQPSELVWQRLCRHLGIGPASSQPARRDGWKSAAAMFALVAMVTAVGWWRVASRPPEVVTETVIEHVPEDVAVALVSDAAGQPLWLARIAPDSAELLVRTVNDVEARPDNDYQLWALTDAGVPVSLGLLPQTGQRSVSLSDAALAAIADSSTVAVSLEPQGGSPESTPTGPVLYTAALLAP